MAGLPREMDEAARIDGASAWSSFRHVTLPLLTPSTFFVVALTLPGTGTNGTGRSAALV